MPKPEFKQGLYKHYRTQGLYHAICLVKHHDSRKDYVLYSSIEHGTLNVRPLFGYNDRLKGGLIDDQDGFFDVIANQATASGQREDILRFTYVGPPKE